MPNLTKTNPIGIDAVIHDIQSRMYAIKDLWGVELTGYPRCYILQDESGKKTIESFLSASEYSRSLIFAEGNKFFFLAPNDINKESANYYTTNLELYFVLNVVECYPNVLHRADEEVRKDVLTALERCPSVKVSRAIINIDKVFNRYNNRISQSYEYEYTDDMQPYHCFKIEMEVLPYYLNQTICN